MCIFTFAIAFFHRARTAFLDEFTWCIRNRYDILEQAESFLAIAYLVHYLPSSTQGFPQGNFCKVGCL